MAVGRSNWRPVQTDFGVLEVLTFPTFKSMNNKIGRSSGWEALYPFQGLQIGESVEVTGVEGNIRSAASMWGTRYGIWLQVNRVDDGIVKVTRIATPKNFKRKDGLREILLDMTTLLINVRDSIEELKEKL